MDDANNKAEMNAFTSGWASRVINALLTDFENGKISLPTDYLMRGINMTEKDDGTFVVGFVFAKEG